MDALEFWPYGHLKGPKTENEALENNVLSSLRPMDENTRRHEKVFSFAYYFEQKWFYDNWYIIQGHRNVKERMGTGPY